MAFPSTTIGQLTAAEPVTQEHCDALTAHVMSGQPLTAESMVQFGPILTLVIQQAIAALLKRLLERNTAVPQA